AIRRKSVVLPEPEGPSSAISSPPWMSSETSWRAAKRSNSLRTLVRRSSMSVSPVRGGFSMTGASGVVAVIDTLQNRLQQQRHQRQQRQQRGDGEGGDEVVFIVKDFDMQRHGYGLAAQAAGNH